VTEIRYGIVIAARDAGSAVIKGVASAAKGAFASMASTAEKARAAMGGLFKNLANIQAGFQMVGRVAKLAARGIGELISATLANRAAGDKQRQDWEAAKKSLAELMGLIGGPLLTAFLAVADAFKPLIAASKEWIKGNKDAMATGIAEWLVKIGRVLVDVVAVGIAIVTNAWSGWSMLIDGLRIGFNSFLSLVVGGVDTMLAQLQRLAEYTGQKGLAASIGAAREEAALLRSTFDSVSADSQKRILETAKAQEALNQKILDARNAIQSALGNVSAATIKRLTDTIVTGTKEAAAAAAEARQLEMENERLLAEYHETMMKRRIAADDAAASRRLAQLNRELDEYKLAEETKRAASLATAEKTKAEQVELASSITSGFSAVKSAAISAFSDLGKQADGTTKTIGDGFLELFKSLGGMIANAALEWAVGEAIKRAAIALTAKQAVAANAANAASGAAASQAGIPIVGPILAIAAMGAMLAAVLALSGGFETGGVLPGPVSPRDNLLFKGAGGEGVLTADTTARVSRDLSGKGGPGSGSPSSSSRGGRGEGPSVAYVSMFGPPNRTDVDRVQTTVIAPSQRRLKRLRAWEG
jgi:hypothetical protein